LRIQSSLDYSARGLDAYFTCPQAVAALLHIENGRLPNRLWEPAAGDGAISRPFLAAGHQVVSTDIADYGWKGCRSGIDYLAAPVPAGMQGIVTNPPFRFGRSLRKKGGWRGTGTAGPARSRPAILAMRGSSGRLVRNRSRFIGSIGRITLSFASQRQHEQLAGSTRLLPRPRRWVMRQCRPGQNRGPWNRHCAPLRLTCFCYTPAGGTAPGSVLFQRRDHNARRPMAD